MACAWGSWTPLPKQCNFDEWSGPCSTLEAPLEFCKLASGAARVLLLWIGCSPAFGLCVTLRKHTYSLCMLTLLVGLKVTVCHCVMRKLCYLITRCVHHIIAEFVGNLSRFCLYIDPWQHRGKLRRRRCRVPLQTRVARVAMSQTPRPREKMCTSCVIHSTRTLVYYCYSLQRRKLGKRIGWDSWKWRAP